MILSWIAKKVSEAIWGFIYNLVADILTKAFQLITDLILKTSDINAYFKIDEYLHYSQAVAGALLILAVAWEGFKQQSGGVLPGDEKSISKLAGQTAVGGLSIFLLPWSVTHMFLPVNNTVIQFIQNVGIKIDTEVFKKNLDMSAGVAGLGGTLILLIGVLAVGFFLLGVTAGIRYIDLIICILVAPFVAISAVRSYEAINIWVRETTAVVFTQAIHILLLEVLLNIMVNVSGVMMLLLCIGCLSVMIKGPNVLRKFMYSTGAGSSTVSAAGAGGRMAAMKIMMKSLK